MSTPFNPYWLEPGAAVPVDIATTSALVTEIQRLRQALAESEQEPVVLNQFLSDVMTAAGLVRHGKQCKALATRLRVEVMRLHAAPPKQQEQEPFGYFHYDLGLELWQETGTGDGKPLYAAPPKRECEHCCKITKP